MSKMPQSKNINKSARRLITSLALGIILTIIIVIGLCLSLGYMYKQDEQEYKHQFIVEKFHNEVIYYNEVVAMSINLSVATKQSQWIKSYELYLPKLDKTLNKLIAKLKGKIDPAQQEKALHAYSVLLALNNKILVLIKHGSAKEAKTILTSTLYKLQLQTIEQWLETIEERQPPFLRMLKLRGKIIHIDEILTSSARMAAATGNPKWEKRYQKFVPLLDDSIKEAIHLAPNATAKDVARAIDAANIRLVSMETKAFKLTNEGRRTTAMKLLFSPEYKTQKLKYKNNMNVFYQNLYTKSSKLLAKRERYVYSVMIISIFVIILLIIMWLTIVRVTKKWRDELIQSNKNLKLLSKSLDEKVKEKTEELVQAQKMESVGRLAGGVAHDFNNILCSIISNVELLQTTDDKNKLNKFASNIRQAALRASELVQQLLGFARKGKYKEEIINLNEIIIEARNLLYRSVSKTIKIELDLAPALWNVIGDPSQLLQVIMNIGINARDAMPDGGKLAFTSENINADSSYCRLQKQLKPGEYVRVTIADNGCGIAKNQLNQIFEPFYTTKDIGKGTGLGLSMVYGIIKNHDGVVTVYSETKKGTVFHVYLPRNVSQKSYTTVVQNHKEKTLSDLHNELVTCTILVVDDESSIREVSKEILKNQGAEVMLAETGEQAIELYQQHSQSINAIVLDVILPKTDGVSVFHKLKQINENVKVLFSSGYSITDSIKDLIKEDQVDFIQKPFNAVAFVLRIKHLINKK